MHDSFIYSPYILFFDKYEGEHCAYKLMLGLILAGVTKNRFDSVLEQTSYNQVQARRLRRGGGGELGGLRKINPNTTPTR